MRSHLEWSEVQTVNQMLDFNIGNGLHSVPQGFDLAVHFGDFVSTNHIQEQLIDALVTACAAHCVQLPSNFITHAYGGHSFTSHLNPRLTLRRLGYLTPAKEALLKCRFLHPYLGAREPKITGFYACEEGEALH